MAREKFGYTPCPWARVSLGGRASTMLTSDRPVEDCGKLLGDSAPVTAMLDRLLHHGDILKCGPQNWRTRTDAVEH